MRLIYWFSAELFSLRHRHYPCQTITDPVRATQLAAYLRQVVFCFRHSSASQVLQYLVVGYDARQLITNTQESRRSVCLSYVVPYRRRMTRLSPAARPTRRSKVKGQAGRRREWQATPLGRAERSVYTIFVALIFYSATLFGSSTRILCCRKMSVCQHRWNIIVNQLPQMFIADEILAYKCSIWKFFRDILENYLIRCSVYYRLLVLPIVNPPIDEVCSRDDCVIV